MVILNHSLTHYQEFVYLYSTDCGMIQVARRLGMYELMKTISEESQTVEIRNRYIWMMKIQELVFPVEAVLPDARSSRIDKVWTNKILTVNDSIQKLA